MKSNGSFTFYCGFTVLISMASPLWKSFSIEFLIAEKKILFRYFTAGRSYDLWLCIFQHWYLTALGNRFSITENDLAASFDASTDNMIRVFQLLKRKERFMTKLLKDFCANQQIIYALIIRKKSISCQHDTSALGWWWNK